MGGLLGSGGLWSVDKIRALDIEGFVCVNVYALARII